MDGLPARATWVGNGERNLELLPISVSKGGSPCFWIVLPCWASSLWAFSLAHEHRRTRFAATSTDPALLITAADYCAAQLQRPSRHHRIPGRIHVGSCACCMAAQEDDGEAAYSPCIAGGYDTTHCDFQSAAMNAMKDLQQPGLEAANTALVKRDDLVLDRTLCFKGLDSQHLPQRISILGQCRRRVIFHA